MANIDYNGAKADIEKIFAQFNFKKEKTQEQINEIIQLALKYITKKTEK